ncbi:Aldehyde dehydrogenase 1 [Helianthus annuus]|uniref:Aldehyde dehydrogenase 1 n=1 Tax=Helianthus annuus TaxID=4232 RepID=A0A251SYM1_HELAN|nr:aldehyde dehydrogenase 1 [Helianthus annuus]KAF5776302.1 putative amorpha-4,11-diene 12 monooxygenase [Helianthus annuus]KAJ0488022.1 Aldehyde dehydrogenase 1 [Helianthus annuus]KAJ0491379.1 Aldehyde dehydrogenase 1 [Helianthus annuus]KAJ0503847.1 Aldehyde dehydrogenase 1 [Helianthus annuus]KAJ0673535.1 Aldehyde dehydrogenase 1 [Helianthus annuus]
MSSKAATHEIKFTKLFINGEFVDSISGNTFETIDPATEEVLATVAEGRAEDVDLAVKAAREAFDNGPWPRLSGEARRKIMLKFADLIDENADELATLEVIDGGKLFGPVRYFEVGISSETFRYFAGAADKIRGATLKMSSNIQAYTLREPIGVVGHIIPWNGPAYMFATKVAPALAAGCTMVIKPAETTPLTVLFFAHLSKLAGVPDGVINVVNGFGKTAGAAISSHMDIDAVTFTGSTEVGRTVMHAAAASNLKPVSLELGGKSPFIVFDDADVDKAAELALMGNLMNKGEMCVAGSRIFVQEGIYDVFVKKLEAMVKAWPMGDPFDLATRHGPQNNKQQYEKILSCIEHGKKEGATLVTGGKPIGKKGYYIEPTLFTDVTDDMTIAKEEIFGPVISVLKFKTIEEVIKRANATKYGLTSGVMTKNIDTANTVSRSIRAGAVWVNCYIALDRDAPHGGYKMSGFGREQGLEALEHYLQVKTVATPIYDSPWL